MDQLYQLTIATPAGTTADGPLTTPWPTVDGTLDAVRILIPDGHAGLTGIRLLMAGQEIVPWSNDDWLVSNDEVIDITMNTSLTATGLSVQTYNLDVFAHTHWVRAQITPLGQGLQVASPTPAPIDNSVLSDLGL